MTLNGELDGIPISLYWNSGGKMQFRCEGVEGFFDDRDKFESAVKRYALKLKKDFTNPQAWMKSRKYSDHDEIHEVTVTSIDAKDAWIKTVRGRQQVRRVDLFASRASLELALAEERRLDGEIKEMWSKADYWKPIRATRELVTA